MCRLLYQTQLHFFSNSRESDDYTERFKSIAATWHDIAELDDDAAAALVAQENLDLLIDMGGHSAGGRPGVILQRPAPVQAKWVGGQHGATGIPTLDYFIS
ncbi:MAG: glycosyltransferase, partial [Synechococcaceae bacterium WB9_4xC_028]|nr:glycosyltransferase [Synechococcaceae bacterium WB9_4xC_028]